MKRTASIPLFALLLSLVLFPLRLHAVELTILHTNDTHGHLLPFSYPEVVDPGSEEATVPVRSDIGGIARRAALVKQIRTEQKGKGAYLWLIDAGDFCDGTPFSTEYLGEADIAAMNASGYDFGTIGNHEFNNKMAQLQKLIKLAQYPVLCANATLTATGEPLTAASTVQQVGPVKVALFGLVTTDAGRYPAGKEGITVADPLETARKIVPELRQKADIVILISHCGKEVDEKLASEIPGLDVIVGGHSHSRLSSGEFIWRSEELKSDMVNGTLIVQAFQWGGELGRCDLLLEQDAGKHWQVERYRERLLPITNSITPDPVVAAVISKFWDPISAKYAEVVGQAAGDFAGRGDDRAEYNLMADALRESMGTDIGLENLGGVRAPLIKGNVTKADLTTMDPFQNTVVTFTLKGSDLKRIVARYKPSVSGMRYRVEGDNLTEITVGGQPLDENKTYTGTSNSYFAGFALKGIDVKDSGKPRLAVLTDYIKKKGTIRPVYDGRRVVLEK